MSLTFTEMQAITNDWFMADNKKAVDIYFKTSWFVNLFMKQKKGLWIRPNGGMYVRVPFVFDENEGDAYERAEPISSDDRETGNAARFRLKHYYGNATIYRADELECAGEYAEVDLVKQKLEGAQNTIAKKIAQQVYNAASDGDKHITGLLSLCNTTTTRKYGDVAEDDLVSVDGTKNWKGRHTTDAAVFSPDIVRTMASEAKLYDGPNGKPNYGFTTEAIFNKFAGILQTQQRFTKSESTAKAGFTGIEFEEKTIAPDDFLGTGYFILVNSAHLGWAIHKDGYFVRTPWADLITANLVAKSLKIYWDGNIICNNRKAHIARSGLTV